MKVRKFEVETFKSLYSVEAPLESLSVITGPNGSGKSNIIESFQFVANIHRYSLEFAISHAGGLSNILFRRSRAARKALRFAVDVEFTKKDASQSYMMYGTIEKKKSPLKRGFILRHEFSVSPDDNTDNSSFSINSEHLRFSRLDGTILADLGYVSSSDQIKSTISDPELAQEMEHFLEYTNLFLQRRTDSKLRNELVFTNSWFMPAVAMMNSFLADIQIHQLSPHASRRSGTPSPNARIDPLGANLPGVADHIIRHYPDAWELIELSMRSIIPNVESIYVTQTDDRRLGFRFREQGISKHWSASEVSDGTIQTLALLIALHDPRSSVLLIEELENALHPWILRNLVDTVKASSRQVILTTHSPIVLNSVDPECVYVAWMDSGRTQVRKLIDFDDGLRNPLIEGELSIFEVYDTGFLQESVPKGLGGVQ